MDKIKKIYHQAKTKIHLYRQINWIKTIYINLRFFTIKKALRFPIVIFGRCTLADLQGKIVLEGPITFGRIGLGQRYQMFKKEKGISEIHILGELRFEGRFQLGLDCKLYIGKNAICTLGDMASLGGNSTLICTHRVSFGTYCRMGEQTLVSDSNFHHMKNLRSGEISPISFEISLGNYNFIGTRVTIMGKTKTPDYTTVASCSMVNKDFTDFGEYILLGGIPSKLIKSNVTRDWEKERVTLEYYVKL